MGWEVYVQTLLAFAISFEAGHPNPISDHNRLSTVKESWLWLHSNSRPSAPLPDGPLRSRRHIEKSTRLTLTTSTMQALVSPTPHNRWNSFGSPLPLPLSLTWNGSQVNTADRASYAVSHRCICVSAHPLVSFLGRELTPSASKKKKRFRWHYRDLLQGS